MNQTSDIPLVSLNNIEGIEPLSKDALLKKFESRLKQLLLCFTQSKVSTCPSTVLDYLKELATHPKKEDLTLFEMNRLNQN